MPKPSRKTPEATEDYYDRRGILGELDEGVVEFALDEELRAQIVNGQRTRRLENVSIKLDPAQILALRKIATMKSIPYQTLIRQWMSEAIRRELHLDKRSRRGR